MATLIKQVQGFVRGQANGGARGLALVTQCIDHMFEHNDWTPLAWMLSKMDSRDASIMRAVVNRTVGGISLSTSSKEAKAQPSGMVIKLGDNAGPTEDMAILRKLVEEGASFRGKDVQAELLKKAPPEFDLHKYAKTVFTKLDKQGVNLKDLMDELLAYKQEAMTKG